MASINSLMLGKDCPSSIIATLRPIGVEYILIVPSFFFTTDIFLCMAGSNDFGLAVI